jgi:uncharacterized protein YbbK (DUF523 family)
MKGSMDMKNSGQSQPAHGTEPVQASQAQGKRSIVLHDRIAIGISACCMGCPVRYNGKGFEMLGKLGREKGDYKWCPVCPESMAGLGVPRDPIHVGGGTGAAVWTGEATVKTRGGRNVTAQVREGAQACMEALKRADAHAYVYMDGSPTCGVYRTTLKKQKRGNPPGVFGALLLENGFFLIPSTDLQSPLRWWDWRRRLLAWSWLRTLPLAGKAELYDAWYRLKFLCQELDDAWARDMGRRLAALGRHVDPAQMESLRTEILNTLRKPSTTKRITNSLWKHYAHYRKISGKSIPDIQAPDALRNITTIAAEVLLMERKALEDDVMNGTSPVLYRQERRRTGSID